MTNRRPAALIADDDEFFRLALRVILIEQLSIPEVLETRSLDDAIEAMSSHSDVQLALFDLKMPGLDAFSAIRATREAFPNVTVAVVSSSRDREDVLRALEAGAHGFVPKGEGVRKLQEAVQKINDGNVYVPSFISDLQGARHIAEDPSIAAATAAETVELDNVTPRQRDVLTYVVKGMSNKEIARALSVSESAVKFHVASLCGRLGVKNRTEIAARASRLSA